MKDVLMYCSNVKLALYSPSTKFNENMIQRTITNRDERERELDYGNTEGITFESNAM